MTITPKQIRWACQTVNAMIIGSSLASRHPWIPALLGAASVFATEYWHKNHRANHPPCHTHKHHRK